MQNLDNANRIGLRPWPTPERAEAARDLFKPVHTAAELLDVTKGHTEVSYIHAVEGNFITTLGALNHMTVTSSVFHCLFPKNTALHDATLEKCTFQAALFSTVKFKNVTFKACNFAGADFSVCQLEDVTFIDCDMYLTRFDASSLERVKFIDSYLACVILRQDLDSQSLKVTDCEFTRTNLNMADLRGTFFDNCTFNYTDLTRAHTKGATRSLA